MKENSFTFKENFKIIINKLVDLIWSDNVNADKLNLINEKVNMKRLPYQLTQIKELNNESMGMLSNISENQSFYSQLRNESNLQMKIEKKEIGTQTEEDLCQSDGIVLEERRQRWKIEYQVDLYKRNPKNTPKSGGIYTNNLSSLKDLSQKLMKAKIEKRGNSKSSLSKRSLISSSFKKKIDLKNIKLKLRNSITPMRLSLNQRANSITERSNQLSKRVLEKSFKIKPRLPSNNQAKRRFK